MADYEKLGAFYLGRIYDQGQDSTLNELLLYDSKDLTTHAVCVGMTGSGKTGLGIVLLEEAAIDGIPSLVIDPKGDMGNLILTFPDIKASDFQPWIDKEAAMRKGLTVPEFAKNTAETWRKGLAEWGQEPERIARFKQAAEVTIYTPGGTAGIPLRILRSFAAPSHLLANDPDGLRDRVQSTVSGLLALLGIDADPIRSREHILLANILNLAWSEGRSLDIASLIQEIQTPPFDQVGVFDLEAFFSSQDRLELAIQLNNLLASPGFSTWMEGAAMDIGSLLYTPQGKPRIAILSIAHLSDSERMFFVTLLLNELVAWMRTQPGTTSLRALLYMDEIFGYFPPTAVPPSKKPMLTLLKQARAYGLGVVLATQNPVDLDYKGLSNTGTWFIGRLQTERDKQRVLDGLEGASQSSGAAFDRNEIDRTLSGLGKRVFLMHNVNENRPVLFQTRWALSYLSGPLTRTQIQTLMADAKETVQSALPEAQSSVPSATVSKETATDKETAPAVPEKISQYYLPRRGSLAATDSLLYRPALLGSSRLHFVSSRAKLDIWKNFHLLIQLSGVDQEIPWEDAQAINITTADLDRQVPTDPKFATLPESAALVSNYTRWKSDLTDLMYQNQTVQIWECPDYKDFSQESESEGDFRGRLAHVQHEKRDLEIEKLREEYSPKLASLEDRIRKAQVKVDVQKSQYGQQKMQTAISVGATVLGALFGRKAVSMSTVGRATTSMRGVGRAAREKEDVARARQEVEVLQERLDALESKFQAEAARIQENFGPEDLELRELLIRPRKSDIVTEDLVVIWTPWRITQDGLAEPLFELS